MTHNRAMRRAAASKGSKKQKSNGCLRTRSWTYKHVSKIQSESTAIKKSIFEDQKSETT